MLTEEKAYEYYPTHNEVDKWVEFLWELSESICCNAEILCECGFTDSIDIHYAKEEFTYVKFAPQEMDEFYGYWQPAMSYPAPLLVHTPGYSAAISMHPDIVFQGYNVLHINPLGYMTPTGPDDGKKRDGNWPVFEDTIISSAKEGYRYWLVNCLLAIKWALSQPEVIKERISFFGTSQGGGAALLLGSIFKDRGIRCIAADVPFLTNIPMEQLTRSKPFPCQVDNFNKNIWQVLGLIDTISHVHRLNCPVLLTAGGKDENCPSDTIKSLFELLPGTCSYNFFKNLEHRASREFEYLIQAWFRMYA